MQQKVEGQKCEYCDGLIVKSPKTGKLFCEKKCWLNKGDTPAQTPPVQSTPVNSDDKVKPMFSRQGIDFAIAKGESFDKAIEYMNRLLSWYKDEKPKTAVQGEFESPLADDEKVPF